jgi:predicted RNA-binding protein with TRAM domain
VYSEASAAIDVERRLRSLVAGSRSQAYRVELSAPIAAVLIGPGATRLQELETMTKRRFFLDGKPDMHADHFVVLGEGKLIDLAPKAPVEEGAELQLELVEVDRHDGGSAVGKVEGFDVCVAEAASLVGKRVKVRVERVLDGVAYATLVRSVKKAPEPLTAEAEAEKPTRKPPARKGADAQTDSEAGGVDDDDADDADDAGDADDAEVEESDESPEELDELELEAPEAEVTAPDDGAPATPVKKKTRRGSRGGKNRKKPAGAAAETTAESGLLEPEQTEMPQGERPPVAKSQAEKPQVEKARAERPKAEKPKTEKPKGEKQVTIHLPSTDLGREDDGEVSGDTPSENGGAAGAKKKTRRGSRGGKNRRKRTAATVATNGVEPAVTAEPTDAGPEAEAAEEPATNGGPEDDWGYVPMSEWADELER